MPVHARQTILDILVEPTPANAKRLLSAFREFFSGETDIGGKAELPNPIRSLEVDGEFWTCDLSHPSVVRDWTAELNEADEHRKVQYWKGRDTFVFSDIGARSAVSSE